jgi:RND family efflux transporter MFP subunit
MIRSLFFPAMAGLLFFASCSSREAHKSDNNSAAINVKTETVKYAAVAHQVAVSGNVEGNTTVDLSFMVGGKINYVSNHEGEKISQGQLIASLDPANYATAKRLADVQVNITADDFNRLKILYDKGSLSENDFSKISFSLQQAKLQQQLQAKNLSDTRLYSPIGGILLKKQTEVGEVVSVGMPLFVISDIRKVKVLAYIPEGELHEIRIGQTADISIPSLDTTFVGKVKEVGSAADATSRAFTIKIEIENPDLLIRPGMIAEASIATNNKKPAILLPAECIQQDLANQSFVFVVDKAQNKVFKRRVSLGNMIDNKIEVVSGLSDEEVVVTSGQKRLSDGSLISITQ